MISTVDKLLLSSAQQAELEQITRAFQESSAVGDVEGMNRAHREAERLRASAGYSGGAEGDQYRLIKTANAPAGYSGYESLMDRYIGGGVRAIAAGYEDQLSQLADQRAALEEQGAQKQAAARSAAWNTQRLAAEGLLTRGLENTGISDVITATALNQAAANAYQALLQKEEALADNDAARLTARAEALEEVADLQADIGKDLGDAYQYFYNKERDLKADQDARAQDYYYTLALQQLKRKWELEDQARGL